MAKRKKRSKEDFSNPGKVVEVPFHDTHRRKYLNYAISVITSRALPDVRDGMKPVQRRILYTMYHNLHLYPDRQTRKCAKIVGEVLGSYHPHGDSAVYEALVRLAQDWSVRVPLVFGQGNFGSIDGDSPAAYRYTEAKLEPISMHLLEDLGKNTVDFRPNFDGMVQEPEVLPARIPHLLINGTTGIAVGLATSIPPHNLKEVIDACIAWIENRKIETKDLLKIIKGPDFPTGGEILESRNTLKQIYEEGQGSIRMRGEYEIEKGERGSQQIVITSVPYQVNKATLVENIGQIIVSRKVPQLLDVRDESTDDIRVVMEIKKDSDPEQVMAYIFKHTNLQSKFSVNLTCLIPGPSGALEPKRANLKTLIEQFLLFRYSVVERRFRHELRLLKDRVHILEGFKKIFNALDEAIRIIRKSDGKKDAAQKLMARFKIDAIQADAILELKLYKLAKLEIKLILDELKDKKKRIREIEAILDSPRRLWTVVKKELKEIGKEFEEKRRTKVMVSGHTETTYDEETFILDEDATILMTKDGWIRRVQRVTDLSKVRLRKDDELLTVIGGNTRSTAVFFTNYGVAYTIRINDIPPSPRGFGDPIQRLFKFKDGEKVIAAYSLDPRAVAKIEAPEGKVPPLHAIAVSSSGYGMRFSVANYSEASTRAGRKFARVKPPTEEIVGLTLIAGKEVLITASQKGRALLCKASEVNFLSGPGKGVQIIKLDKTDRILGFSTSQRPREGLTVLREGGKKIPILPQSYRVTSRAGKGFEVIKRGRLAGIEAPEITLPDFLEAENGKGSNGSKKKKK